MTNQTFPITPPLGLINQWWDEAKQNAKYDEPIGPLVATKAAQWGADQELDACCEWTQSYAECGDALRLARRPMTPSLKEQALRALEDDDIDVYLIRRALEALPND